MRLGLELVGRNAIEIERGEERREPDDQEPFCM
jgi:hypothetical protein